VPLAAQVAQQHAQKKHPLVLGICGPQGSGKSTLALFLRELLSTRFALRVAILSLDDLYLSRDQRSQLAAQVHPLLITRGVPGTHDVALGFEVIQQLCDSRTDRAVTVPRFNKATDSPAAPEIIHGPMDVVIFEGWCIGAQPQPESALQAPINALEATSDPDGRWRRFVNDQLAGPYQALFAPLDWLVMLEAPDFDCVYRWRALQEHKLWAKSERGMDDEQLHRFIQHYERLTRWMLTEMPARADSVLTLDSTHAVVSLRSNRVDENTK
jgi:D-glycerate 3-kinase